MLRAIFIHNLDELIVLLFIPHALLDAISPLLIVSVEALAIVALWYKCGYFHPIRLLQLLCGGALAPAVSIDCPNEKLVFVF